MANAHVVRPLAVAAAAALEPPRAAHLLRPGIRQPCSVPVHKFPSSARVQGKAASHECRPTHSHTLLTRF